MLSKVLLSEYNFHKEKNNFFIKNAQSNFFAISKTAEKDIFVKDNISFKSKLKDVKLGSNYNKKTKELEFGVFSKNANRINLYIFDAPKGKDAIAVIPMEKARDNKWVCKIDKTMQKELNMDILHKKPVYYGYRAWGPNWEYNENWKPESDIGFKSHVDKYGNRFNPNKLLTDPYAKEVTHDPISPDYWDGSIYATGDEYYLKDSAKIAPKSIFMMFDDVKTGKKPKHSLKDDVIYEVHIKGFSKLDDKIPEKYRGTYKGAAMKAPYLKKLGITMVEFLPTQEFQNYGNYWGYMTNQFFAPEREYAYDKSAGGPTKEFKEMVKTFHDNGIKVCMDVVYNHTGEGGIWSIKDAETGLLKEDVNVANLYSMRGLDSQTYYEPSTDKRYYYDNTGCGGNYNIAEDAARDLVVDSIKYWSEEMGVDSFRFDLAPVLGNHLKEGGFEFDTKNQKGFFKVLRNKVDIRTDRTKKGIDLIAEPWGVGIDNQKTEGHFPFDWKEWSGNFRNTVKTLFKNPEEISWGKVANVICGQKDFYGGKTSRAINFVTCHDNLTINDYFTDRKFYKNPDQNSKKSIRNSILTTLISKGTPMILGGDEIFRTQNGDPNPYDKDCNDYYINWNLNETQNKMLEFTGRAINFRKQHSALTNTEYFNGLDNNDNGIKDITWLDSKANEIAPEQKYMDNNGNDFLAFRIDGTEFEDKAASIYTVINKGTNNKEFCLPENLDRKNWYFVADTSENSEQYMNFLQNGKEVKVGKTHNISPNSMMLFIEK